MWVYLIGKNDPAKDRKHWKPMYLLRDINKVEIDKQNAKWHSAKATLNEMAKELKRKIVSI